jgi:hypothetical protein
MKTFLHYSIAALAFAAATAAPISRAEAGAFDEVKDAVRSFPRHAKEAGIQIGHTARDTGRAIGHGAKEAALTVRDGAKRDFGPNGAFRNGPRGTAPTPGRTDPP